MKIIMSIIVDKVSYFRWLNIIKADNSLAKCSCTADTIARSYKAHNTVYDSDVFWSCRRVIIFVTHSYFAYNS